MPSARLILSGLAFILAAGSWRPASILAQLPAGTPTYNANAKWVTDRGSQVFNVKAFGATGNGTTDDTAAINAAKSAAGAGGTILFPPGNYVVSAQLQFTAQYQMISGFGANLICNLATATDCVYIGTTAGPAYQYSGDTFYGLELTPGANTSGSAAIRDNGQDVHFFDVHGLYTNSTGYTFLHFLEDDDDQNMIVDHLYNMSGMITCNSTTCGSILYAPHGASYAGLAYVTNSNFSSNYTANDVDWESGNHLTISKCIFQSWAQYALRTNSPVDIDGFTHFEQGGCSNPLNDGNGHALGCAGLIEVGGSVTSEGGSVGGVNATVFSTNAVAGSTTYWYYVVGHTAGGVTAPLIAGYLSNGGSTVSGSAQNYVVWPALATTGVISYDVLRILATVPYGTGNWAVTTGLSASTACGANGVCEFTDTVGSPSSYTIATETVYPWDTFWPGNLVLFSAGSGGGAGTYSGPVVSSTVVNTAPNDTTNVHVNFTGLGQIYLGANPVGPGLIVEGNQKQSGNTPPAGQMYPRGLYNSLSKGMINFGTGGYMPAQDFVTINDSNQLKTLADVQKRPTADAADTALCGDPPYATGACLRGPTVSQYVNVLPDGSHWSTRTYSTGIADAVPHYGFSTTAAGAPNTPSLTDASSATTCQRSHTYALNAVCFDGTNFELATTASPYGSASGATAPTWATTPGATTLDAASSYSYVVWTCLGTGSLAANTAYYFKTAGCTLGGCSTASSQATVTTANDSSTHMVLLTATAKAGHTSYQVGCSTSTGTEALLTAPYTGAYTGNGYVLPVMGCSGSGSFNSTDQTGYASVIGMCFNGANCNTSWPVTGYATVDANGTAQTQRSILNLKSGTAATVSCADNSGAGSTDCTFSSTGTGLPASSGYRGTTDGAVGSDTGTHTYWFGVNGNSWPLCTQMDFSCVSLQETWAEGFTSGAGTLGFLKYYLGSNATNPGITNISITDLMVVGWTTDATSGHGGQLMTAYYLPVTQTNWLYKVRFAQPQAATDETHGEIFHVGLQNYGTSVSSYPHMVGLSLDTTLGDTTWQLVVDNGSARTAQATGVSLGNAFHTLTIGSLASGEYAIQLDAGTVYCFTAAASGGCTNTAYGSPTVINSANVPTGTNLFPFISDTAESANGVVFELGRVAVNIRGLSSP
jgi:hypothetical protein